MIRATKNQLKSKQYDVPESLSNPCKYVYFFGLNYKLMKTDIHKLMNNIWMIDHNHGLEKWISSRGVSSIWPSKCFEILEIGIWSVDVINRNLETGSWSL